MSTLKPPIARMGMFALWITSKIVLELSGNSYLSSIFSPIVFELLIFG
jgi:hypothetical protein